MELPVEPMLGLHVSIEQSLELSFDRAEEIGCTAFQIFTRNPRIWKFKPLSNGIVTAFLDRRKRSRVRKVVAHMPYLPNLASPDRTTMKVSRLSLDEEVKRCDALGIDFLVAHLGSHLGKGTMAGVRNVAGACNEALAGSNGDTVLLLENMAGQKNSVGSRLEELGRIIELVKRPDKVGVCVDTCHLFAAGFDLSSPEAVEPTMGVLDKEVGYDRLRVVHLNDSKGALGSNLDRHENIGKGRIGVKGLKAFLHYRGILERPIILETPYEDLTGMKESIATVKKLIR